MTKSIVFIDLEVHTDSNNIQDAGVIHDSGQEYHSHDLPEFLSFIKNVRFLCGHNIIQHDIEYLKSNLDQTAFTSDNILDTLYLSALLFPSQPYHHLVKDEKLQTGELNNPLTDAKKARELFHDEVSAFNSLENSLKDIFYLLLGDKKEFGAFFRYMDYQPDVDDPVGIIKDHFKGLICENADVQRIVDKFPIEFAYSLALINVNDRFSLTPPWVLKNYPEVESVMDLLRNRHCLGGCSYCNRKLDAHRALKKYFGYETFREFGGKPLQQEAVQAAIDSKSLLAVFPTGGGKSLAFQIPALICGENVTGLTVVISPLQSLMKDQVDNLENNGITAAATINGLLDPIERKEAVESVLDGSASILYISPESLRSKTIERLLLSRRIVRFVIDEAHCFSAWGQDFRVDYMFIGDFIKSLQEKKNLQEAIPVSCFTATAKPQVVEDIKDYFRETLSIEMNVFQSDIARENLEYKVFRKSVEEKYSFLRSLLETRECPTIVYVSRTKAAYDLADRLSREGFAAKPYHGKMETREKVENQEAFIAGDVQIIVATSAFGMGVDKKDVGLVVHYEISDSLENYVQEAGRAGRDENITAECYILFCEDDLDKHFSLLNQTKLNIKEIQQIWKAIKDITRTRLTASQSALEIARQAGWDDSVKNIETRVRTAIAALEDAGYIKRKHNMPRVFADSICCQYAYEASAQIKSSKIIREEDKQDAARIIQSLVSARSLSRGKDSDAESRVDWLSDRLGLERRRTIDIINLLREEGILADSKDLQAYIKNVDKGNPALRVFESFSKIENFLISALQEREAVYNVKELNEMAQDAGCKDAATQKLRKIINYWQLKKMIKYERTGRSPNHVRLLRLLPEDKHSQRLNKLHELARFIIEYLYTTAGRLHPESEREKTLINFSVKELKDAYCRSKKLLDMKVSPTEIEDALLYLSRIGALNIEGGFLVLYNPMTIERLEKNSKIRYKKEDYTDLKQHYNSKKQQIHIVGEYARKMLENYSKALEFVKDYFRLNYASFLQKYFPGAKKNEITRNISPGKFKQLFGELSPTQLRIINDSENQHIAVVAGPGSGKTRVLVHKLASLILMEDVKHEQLLMLTFSRAAATEFKKRLSGLVGSAAHFIKIKTFHSYCFDLLGRVGNVEKSADVFKETIEVIKNGDVEPSRITKMVLVIDEAQDMDSDVYALIQTLMAHNEDMRVIAVGDDDQNIFEFRGSSSRYLQRFMDENRAERYELLENYRSKRNIVDFTNQFAICMRGRLKENEIVAHDSENGKIQIIRHPGGNLIVPLVDGICRDELAGSTAVLTQTNDEALQITGLLRQRGLPAQLIQNICGFDLRDLAEMRFFMKQLDFMEQKVQTISNECWENAKSELKKEYARSAILPVCRSILLDFEEISPNEKYGSDFKIFLRESNLEDFYPVSRERILVSTIHKAKGREYDNVYLMLDDYSMNTEEDKRKLYVAMTRAKKALKIHLNRPYLHHIRVEGLRRMEDKTAYASPARLTMHLEHSDVWLDYFYRRRHVVDNLQSGDKLQYRDNFFLNERGCRILKPSSSFLEELNKLREKGYVPAEAKVNFVVFWKKETEEQEVKIVLPELQMENNEV